MPAWTLRQYLTTECLLFAVTGVVLGYALAAHPRAAFLIWAGLGWNLALLYVSLDGARDEPPEVVRARDEWDQLLVDAAAQHEEARRQ